jgi:hypothetical protein
VVQHQILEDEVAAGTTSTNKDAKQQIEEAHHRRGRISAASNSRRPRDKHDARSGVRLRNPLLPPYKGRGVS